MVGLTATPQRRDGQHPITEMQLGPARFTVDAKSQAARRPFEHRLVVRETSFLDPNRSKIASIQELYAALAVDQLRNELILNDVIASLEEGRSPILLTERKDHLEFFAERLEKFARHLVVLHGTMTARARKAAAGRSGRLWLEALPHAESRPRPREPRLPRLEIRAARGKLPGSARVSAKCLPRHAKMPVSCCGEVLERPNRADC